MSPPKEYHHDYDKHFIYSLLFVIKVPPSAPPSAPPPSSQSKSLSEIQNIDEVEDLSVKELKCILTANFVDFKGCCEKKELLERVRTLWKSKQYSKRNSKSQFCDYSNMCCTVITQQSF